MEAKYYINFDLLQKRHDEIQARIDGLISEFEKCNMSRSEYLDQLVPLAGERTAIERTFAAMRRANAEAEKIRRIGVGVIR